MSAWLDIGERPTQPPEADITEAELDAIEAEARATVEDEARHVNFWLGIFDEHDIPLDTATLGRELHKAYMGGTVRHCLRDVALEHVERMVTAELGEMIDAD